MGLLGVDGGRKPSPDRRGGDGFKGERVVGHGSGWKAVKGKKGLLYTQITRNPDLRSGLYSHNRKWHWRGVCGGGRLFRMRSVSGLIP